jgi:ribosomal protein S18 acetylase RimI-like enzyme
LAIELGRLLKKEMIWLGVIDNNLNAIEFYERMGFEFYDKTQLDLPYFKEHLKGMWRMTFKL